MLFQRSINTEQVKEFVSALCKKNKGRKLILFMDNMKVHKSHEMLHHYETKHVKVVFNLPYSPQLNGIESYFSIVKNSNKNDLLRKLVNKESYDVKQIIITSLKNVKKDAAVNCITESERYMLCLIR